MCRNCLWTQLPISIHASLAGGDSQKLRRFLRSGISIHASLAGGDQRIMFRGADDPIFQSTPPSREATEEKFQAFRDLVISIHASLAGGDKISSSSAI